MIPLFDDFYHVQSACTLLESNEDRKLIAGIHCWLGESPDHSRIFGLFLTFLMVAVAYRLFVLPFRPSDKPHSKLSFLAITFHPMVAFSYIYASQLSTTVTCAWALGWVGLWEKVRGISEPRQRFTWIVMGLLYSSLAGFVRMEAWVYGWLLWVFHEFLKHEFSGRRLSIKNQFFWICLASLPALIRPAWVSFLLSVIRTDLGVSSASTSGHLLSSPTPSGVQVGSVWSDWLITQAYACWLYLRNLLIPHFHSFYGPWHRAWEIVHHWERWFWPLASGSVLTFGVIAVFKRIRIRSVHLRRVAIFLLFFFVPTLVLSSVPRNDWYNPARQMLGSLMALCWALQFLTQRNIRILGFWTGSALLLAPLWHYSSLDSFFEAERVATFGAPSPWVEHQEGVYLIEEGDERAALEHFKKNHESFSLDQLQSDHRAALISSLSLYHIWLLHRKRGEDERSLQALNTLMQSNFYPAPVACLQDDRVPVDQCITERHLDQYCLYYRSPGIPPLPQLKSVRRNPCIEQH